MLFDWVWRKRQANFIHSGLFRHKAFKVLYRGREKHTKQDIRTTVKLPLRQLKHKQANKEQEENIPFLGKAVAPAHHLLVTPPKTPHFSSCVNVGMFLLWMEPGHPPPSGRAALSLPCRAEVDTNLIAISDRKQISTFPNYSLKHTIMYQIHFLFWSSSTEKTRHTVTTWATYWQASVLRNFYVMNPINFSVRQKCKLRFALHFLRHIPRKHIQRMSSQLGTIFR